MMRIFVVRGGLSGLTRSYESSSVSVGRHPDNDLCLDPRADLHASANHAVLLRVGDNWMVRDLGSSNGTYVNSVEVAGDTTVTSGDRVRFGADGPEIIVTFATEAEDLHHPSRTEPKSNGTRRLMIGVTATLTVVAGGVAVGWMNDRSRWSAERRLWEASVDSTLHAGRVAEETLEGRLASLRYALDQSQRSVEGLRDELQEATRDSGSDHVEELRAELRTATEALRRQQLAATLDFDAIESANRQAIALIYAEGPDGTATVASGFAIRESGLMVTNHHVVHGSDGRRAARVGVQFTGSRQVFPAEVVAASERDDLALLQIRNIAGDVPTVAGLGAQTDSVDVVAVLGFPLAASQAKTELDDRTPEPLLTAGVVMDRRFEGSRVAIQGYGAQGASGSPVFGPRGRVVGVVYGGLPDSSTPTVLAIPVRALNALLHEVADSL